MTSEIFFTFGLFIVPFLFALSFHEFAHAFVAKLKGDNTAEMLGRLTLNPVPHIDIVGTIIFPSLALFLNWPLLGWARPVPVNSRNLSNIRKDMFWIAFAGPLSNVFLAIVGSVVMYALISISLPVNILRPIFMMLEYFVMINLFLAVFNMLPVHPLDGGKILGRFLPARVNIFLEQNQSATYMLLFVLVMTKGLVFLGIPVHIASGFLIPPFPN